MTETHDLSKKRYEKGLDSYLSVLDSYRSLCAAKQALVGLRLSRLASQIRLYAVLGRGVESNNFNSIVRNDGIGGHSPPYEDVIVMSSKVK